MKSDAARSDFKLALKRDRELVENRLDELTAAISEEVPLIKEAVRYSLLGGGKRLRPVLCLWTHDLMGGNLREGCLDVACAIECLHTYSLIHDDLPCMDDDDTRRGKPSSHKRFGEANAVLAGDALLTFTFEIISGLAGRANTSADLIVEVIKTVSRAAGVSGLISGQVLDLESEKSSGGMETVEMIHEKKTAVLIAASMEAGSIMSGADKDRRELIRRAGMLAGRAFQIIDDTLDVTAEDGVLGKTARKDIEQGKLTYPSVAGLQASREAAFAMIREAKEIIADLGPSERMCGLLDLVVERSS